MSLGGREGGGDSVHTKATNGDHGSHRTRGHSRTIQTIHHHSGLERLQSQTKRANAQEPSWNLDLYYCMIDILADLYLPAAIQGHSIRTKSISGCISILYV